MARPITETERAEIINLLATGTTCNAIAQQVGRSPDTISRIAKSIGHRFGHTNAVRAREARSAYSAERRATIAARFTIEAERLLDQLHAPHLAFNFGGKDNTYEEHELAAPPVDAKRQIVQAAREAMRTVLDIDRHDNRHDDNLSAVDDWLRGVIGDTAGMETVMSSLEEAWSSLMRDIDLGKRRIIVPDEFLTRNGRGQGAVFDGDREVFSPLMIEPSQQPRAGIEVVDFTIRATDHLETARSLFTELVHDAGYSSSSVGDDRDGGVKTATEVASQDSLSVRTTGKKRRYWGPGLCEILGTVLRLDRGVFGTTASPEAPVIEWPTVDESADTARTLNLLAVSQSASLRTRVAMLHPQWSAEQVDAEVDVIRDEQGLGPVQVTDPTGGFV